MTNAFGTLSNKTADHDTQGWRALSVGSRSWNRSTGDLTDEIEAGSSQIGRSSSYRAGRFA
jgi:hypothetical protein